VAPIKTRNPVKADATHTFSNDSMMFLPTQHPRAEKLEIFDSWLGKSLSDVSTE